MQKTEIRALLQRLQGTKFRDFSGATVMATIPVSERLINEIVAASIPTSGHLREAHVHPEAGNRFAVRVTPRAALIPSITVKVEIERQPDLPASPVLVLRMATLGGLFGMAASALPIGRMLPPGVRLDREHIHIDLRALAAQRDFGEALDYVKRLRVTTEDGRVVVQLEATV